MEKTVETVSKVFMLIAVAAGMAMASLVVLGVLMRYFLGSPLSFSDELVGLFFIVIAFAILPACELRGRNISVTLVVDMLPPRLKEISRIARMFLTVIFSGSFTYLAINFAITSAHFNARMETLDLSIVPWILIIPVGVGIVGIIAVVRVFRAGFGESTEGNGALE